MNEPKLIAVVQGAKSAIVQRLFRDFAARWSASARIVGVVEEGYEELNHACGGALRSISDNARFDLQQDLGPHAIACYLDASGAVAASAAIERESAHGCDLVILNKFDKLEADRSGLLSAFSAAVAAAVAADLPILTSVSPKFVDAWSIFAAPLFTMLPAEPQQLDAWWKSVVEHRANS